MKAHRQKPLKPPHLIWLACLTAVSPAALSASDGEPVAVIQTVETKADFHRRLQRAEAGDAAEMGHIAVLYMTGKGPVQRNDAEAAKWCLKAALHRHWQSMITMSSLYAMGKGLPPDQVEAVAWANLATSNARTAHQQRASANQAQSLASPMSSEDQSKVQQRTDAIRKTLAFQFLQ